MKEISLTRGKITLIDNEDYEWLNQWKWAADKYKNTFYAKRNVHQNGIRTTVFMHREILGLSKGDGNIADHKNRNGLDNRRSNLRKVTYSLNGYNKKMQTNNISGYRGVCWNKERGKWMSRIAINNEMKFCGRFTTVIEAAIAYDQAAIRFYDNDAILNFPEEVI